MVMSCQEVWQQVSNYLDNDIDASLRAAIEEHLRGCKHCTAVLDGTRNVVSLYTDGKVFELPLGFSARVHARLAEEMRPRRGGYATWMMAAAAALLLAGTFLIGDSRAQAPLRSEHAEQAAGIPPGMLVEVSSEGKTFHARGCPFLHEKDSSRIRLIAASDALRAGYVPCVRCMRQYLRQ